MGVFQVVVDVYNKSIKDSVGNNKNETNLAATTLKDLTEVQDIANRQDDLVVICDKCDFETITMSDMTNHKKEVHTQSTRLYVCHQCEKTFNNKTDISIHNNKW